MEGTPTALAGIRIVDLSMGWAGPLACRQLADMGADVIKVESCERFDWWRSWEATPEWIEDNGAEKSTAFNTVNRNKRNITLDLEDEEGRDLLLQLIATANVVVENYSGSVLPKLNLGYEIFREVNEKIILVSMPPFGSNGAWAQFRAYGSTVEQSAGLPHLTGLADDAPTMMHVALGDSIGGLTGASALLVALRHQARTGEGQFVDLSQVEGLFPLASHGILEFSATGKAPPRAGNANREYAPHGVYPCAGEDTWIVIEARDDREWNALLGVVGSSLADFGNMPDRLARRSELDAALAAWTRARPAQEAEQTLRAAGMPAAATLGPGDVLNSEQLIERGYWQWLERAVVGNQPNPSAPFREAGNGPHPIAAPAPTLGQHNAEVLGGVLGLTEADLVRLTASGVIGTRPRMPGTKPG